MNARSLPSRPVLELLFATSIWGFGFIATRMALDGLGPLWLTAARFGIAGAVGLLLVGIFAPVPARQFVQELRESMVPGAWLATHLGLQTIGMQYTTATNSGFLTTLYVLFVPLLGLVLGRTRVTRSHAFLVVLALGGAALIGQVDKLIFNIGDLWTVGCALAGAVHIHVLGAYAMRAPSPLRLNVNQSLWVFFFVTPVAIVFDKFPTAMPSPRALVGLMFVALASTLIAFLFQVRAQRTLAPSLVSMLCLLESPFAAVFAYFVLNERLTGMQTIGAGVIMLASVGAIALESRCTPPSSKHAPVSSHHPS